MPSAETMGQASEASVPSVIVKSPFVQPAKSAAIESAAMKPAAVETPASAVRSSVAEV